MPDIKISVDTKELERNLRRMVTEIDDWSKPLGEVGDQLIGVYGSESIKTQGRAVGEQWKALSRSTLTARAMRTGYYRRSGRGGSAALLWTGNLSRGFKKDVSRSDVVVSNPVPYFKHHQNPRRPGRPPRRRMMGITRKIENGIIKTMSKYLASIINR